MIVVQHDLDSRCRPLFAESAGATALGLVGIRQIPGPLNIFGTRPHGSTPSDQPVLQSRVGLGLGQEYGLTTQYVQ